MKESNVLLTAYKSKRAGTTWNTPGFGCIPLVFSILAVTISPFFSRRSKVVEVFAFLRRIDITAGKDWVQWGETKGRKKSTCSKNTTFHEYQPCQLGVAGEKLEKVRVGIIATCVTPLPALDYPFPSSQRSSSSLLLIRSALSIPFLLSDRVSQYVLWS